MKDAIAWLVVFAVVGLMIWALARDNKSRRNRTKEEYERDVAEARESMLRSGMLELDKFFGNVSSKRAAVEYLKDQEQGMTRTGSNSDDDERTKAEN